MTIMKHPYKAPILKSSNLDVLVEISTNIASCNVQQSTQKHRLLTQKTEMCYAVTQSTI